MTLYAGWRWFVTTYFPSGELTLLAFADWNWRLLPRILAAVLTAMFRQGLFFVVLLAVIALAVRRLRERAWDRPALVARLSAGTAMLFVGFIIFTYVAHFDPASAADAHSFSRYTRQLSLIAVLALVCAARPRVARWLGHLHAASRRRLGTGLILLTLVLPLATIHQLRFDLDAPQPTVFALARDVAATLAGRRLALLLPGDVDDGVGSMLRGAIMFVPPRLRDLDFEMRLSANPETLAEVAAAGYDEAFISCTSAGIRSAPGLGTLPNGVAVFVRHTSPGWSVVRVWRYEPDLAAHRFAALIERAPLCAGPVRDVSPAISWHRSSSPVSAATTE
jgi:hypothetical protein